MAYPDLRIIPVLIEFERVERLQQGVVRIARRQHQQSSFALALNKYEAIFGRVFRLPTIGP